MTGGAAPGADAPVYQVVGFCGVRTQTSKNVSRSCPDTSCARATKSDVLAVPPP